MSFVLIEVCITVIILVRLREYLVGVNMKPSGCLVYPVVVVGGAVPWKNSIASKKKTIAAPNDGEGGSFIVAVLVEISFSQSICNFVSLLSFLLFFFVWWRVHT